MSLSIPMPHGDAYQELISLGKSLLSLPALMFHSIQQVILDWNTVAINQPGSVSTGELGELKHLYTRLLRYKGEALQIRTDLCQRVVEQVFVLSLDKSTPPLAMASLRLVSKLVANEGHFSIPKVNLEGKLSTVQIWDLTSTLKKHLAPFENSEVAARIEQTLEALLRNLLYEQSLELPYDEAETPLFVPFHDMLSQPALRVETVLAVILNEPTSESLFPHLWRQLERNILIVTGLDPDDEGDRQRPPVLPTQSRNQEAAGIIQDYFADTPLVDFLQTPLPFSIPFSARFAHTHILGGSGHGKTQLLQHMILDDLKKLTEGKGSIVVIDSQGDLIRTITHLVVHPANLLAFSSLPPADRSQMSIISRPPRRPILLTAL